MQSIKRHPFFFRFRSPISSHAETIQAELHPYIPKAFRCRLWRRRVQLMPSCNKGLHHPDPSRLSSHNYLDALQSFEAGEFMAPLEPSRLTRGPKAYTSVQCGPGPNDHVELNSDLVYSTSMLQTSKFQMQQIMHPKSQPTTLAIQTLLSTFPPPIHLNGIFAHSNVSNLAKL